MSIYPEPVHENGWGYQYRLFQHNRPVAVLRDRQKPARSWRSIFLGTSKSFDENTRCRSGSEASLTNHFRIEPFTTGEQGSPQGLSHKSEARRPLTCFLVLLISHIAWIIDALDAPHDMHSSVHL